MRTPWFTLLCAGVALAQTLIYFVYLRDDPGNYNGAGAGGDQVAYIDLAQQILHGTWEGAVHYMPGLPAVIALGQAITGDPRLGIAVLQAVLYAGLVFFAARLAARVFGDHTAPWAAAGVGLNPALGYYAAQALTEFLTAVVLFGLVASIFAWARRMSLGRLVVAGALIAAAGYLRAEYLGLAVLFALIVFWLARREPRQALAHAATIVGVTALLMAPWVVRYALATGRPALYNESPFSNLMLMGTWFRVFDEQTFSELQQIETAPGSREAAIAQASTVGPRPELSQRYMEQARGPYERPVLETVGLMAGNVQLNTRQYLINHLVLAPVLIWAGHTPVRQSDAPRLPSAGRYAIWGAELLMLVLAVWQAVTMLFSKASGSRVDPQGCAQVDPHPPTPSPFLRERGSFFDLSGNDDVGTGKTALALSFIGLVLFLTAVHTVIAVDERFTTPALPLVGLFAGARLASLLRVRQPVVVGYAS